MTDPPPITPPRDVTLDVTAIENVPPDQAMVELSDGTRCTIPAGKLFALDKHWALQAAISKATGRMILLRERTRADWDAYVRQLMREGPQDE